MRNRGRELPGTFGPLIIGQIFLEEVVQAVHYVLCAALSHVCDPSTQEAVLRCVVYSKLDRLEKELQEKVTELFKPYNIGHAITYNHYLTDNVHKVCMRGIKKTLEQFFGDDYTNLGTVKLSVNAENLTKLLATKTEAVINNYASSTAMDFMEAYYKV
jgi:hypothetical protein